MAIIKVITKNNPKSIYIKKYHDMNSYHDVISYVLNPDKTDGYCGSWGIDLPYAEQEMRLLTQLYHHDKDDGIKLRHWIIAFDHDDIAKLCSKLSQDKLPYALCQIGFMLTAFYRLRYQIIFGVHWVHEANPHIHIVMNTTSYVDGHKFHGDIKDYKAYEKFAKGILGSYQIPVYYTKDQTSNKYY